MSPLLQLRRTAVLSLLAFALLFPILANGQGELSADLPSSTVSGDESVVFQEIPPGLTLDVINRPQYADDAVLRASSD